MSAAAFAAGPATAQTLFGVEIQGNVGYSDNPFLQPGDDRDAFSVGVQVRPSLTRATATSQTSLTGTFDLTEYLSRYGSNYSAQVALSHNQQLSETVTASGTIGYSDSRNALIGVFDEVDPVTSGERRRRLFANGQLSWQLTSLDRLQVSGFYDRQTYPSSNFLRSSDQYGARGYYYRRINERLEVGASLGVSRSKTSGFRAITAYEPRAELTYRISEVFEFSGGAGVSITRDLITDERKVDPAYNAQLCATYPRTTACLSAQRSATASAIGGQQDSTNINLTVTHQLSELSSITASAQYARSSTDTGLINVDQRLFGADLGYNRRLTERLSFTANVNYRQREYPTLGNERGIAATIGLQATLGRTR